MELILDHSALRRLAEPTSWTLALTQQLVAARLWPALVPSVCVTEALSGDDQTDRQLNEVLACCRIVERVPLTVARRASWLRTATGRSTSLDALLVALAEPRGGILVAGRRDSVEALALFADEVFVERI